VTDEDEVLGRQVADSIHRRVRSASPQLNVERLLEHTETKVGRQRRNFAFALIVVLILGGVVGFVVGQANQSSGGNVTVAALDDGTPPVRPATTGYQPSDVVATTAEIASAFHDAFAGGVPTADKLAAMQDGAAMQRLLDESRAQAGLHGYTNEQLDGSTITVLDTSFIDATHAIVRFTIDIPGHGQILADRIGYAVQGDGRWRVALRTVCDLLSLDGLGRQCPPAGH
jgi:hypothetical protein